VGGRGCGSLVASLSHHSPHLSFTDLEMHLGYHHPWGFPEGFVPRAQGSRGWIGMDGTVVLFIRVPGF